MTDNTPRGLADEVFKHELKASEKMTQLFTEFDPQQAEAGMLESFDVLMENIDDEQRTQKAIMLMQTLAQKLESERLLERAIEEAETNPLVDTGQGAE